MWKLNEPSKDIKNITLNETVALDSNYGLNNSFSLTRPLKNIISLHPNTLVIKNFSIDVTDFHYKSMADDFISSSKQKLGQLTLLDFKYVLVNISAISNNQIGARNSKISECSGVFIMDNMYSSSTNNALTGKNDVRVHIDSNSPDSLVLILTNISSKKNFLPYLGGISHFDVKLMLPDGREIKRRNEVLHLSSIKDEKINQSFPCAGGKPILSGSNKKFTFENASDIEDVSENNIIKKTTTTSSPAIEYRVITVKTDTTITIDKAFTNDHVNDDTLDFLEVPIMWIKHNSNKRFFKIKVQEYFSPLEFKKGDMIRITGSELLFLDREKGHMIVDVKHKGPSTTHSHLKNIIVISDDYSVNEGEITTNETETINNMDFTELQTHLSGKSIEIRNLSNNYLLTIDAEINIQNL